MAKDKKVKNGNVLMKARKGVGGCSVGGKEYANDKGGFIEVPAEYADALIPHGYDPVAAEVEGEAEAEQQPVE